MIIKENVTIDGVEFIYTHSDAGMKIEREGVQYSEAYDPVNTNREYVETNIPVPVFVEPEIIEDTEQTEEQE